MDSILNFNVGILGHVDSGKTSLAKALSTVASTAAFDKNPQSKERGITLDLGFSSFQTESPNHIKEAYEKTQYTLVDCPGHASLIRTIIGGAQIIDLMILVVDIVKGVQTQTAECLVIGEITCSYMMVILNKVDLLSTETREASIQKMTKKMRATLSKTKFKDSPIIPVAAKCGGTDSTFPCESIGMTEMIESLKRLTFLPSRDPNGPFIFSVDHCFGIKGQGTVMTGTVLSGSVEINSAVEIASLKEVRKVKSIQIFRKPASRAIQGDRAGICVTQFDSSLLERGLVCKPGVLPSTLAIIIGMDKIRFYKGDLVSGTKYHCSIGHSTVLCNLTLFFHEDVEENESFDFNNDYSYAKAYADIFPDNVENEKSDDRIKKAVKIYALLEFDNMVVIPPDAKVLGSRLDTDVHTSSCRLAFEGQIVHTFKSEKYKLEDLNQLKVFKLKEKTGVIERANNDYELIGKNMFKKESNLQLFDGFKVKISTGEIGFMDGPFGQSGKFKIRLKDPLSEDTKMLLGDRKKKKDVIPPSKIEVLMAFKKYIFSKKMAQ